MKSIILYIIQRRSRDMERELTSSKYIPFGISAMRLPYKANGTLYRIDADGGGTHPVVRAGSSNPNLVDPVSDPTYNMGDLFLNNVPVNPEHCIPLDIVTQTTQQNLPSSATTYSAISQATTDSASCSSTPLLCTSLVIGSQLKLDTVLLMQYASSG
jgi:hypothetical protein